MCRRRGNAEATVVTKDRAASRFLAYLVEVGVDDLAALGVLDVSGFLLRERGLRRKTIASLRVTGVRALVASRFEANWGG